MESERRDLWPHHRRRRRLVGNARNRRRLSSSAADEMNWKKLGDRATQRVTSTCCRPPQVNYLLNYAWMHVLTPTNWIYYTFLGRAVPEKEQGEWLNSNWKPNSCLIPTFSLDDPWPSHGKFLTKVLFTSLLLIHLLLQSSKKCEHIDNSIQSIIGLLVNIILSPVAQYRSTV